MFTLESEACFGRYVEDVSCGVFSDLDSCTKDSFINFRM